LSRNLELYGIGVDLVEWDRASRMVRRHACSLQRILTPHEAALFRRSRLKAKSFAVLFSAKEAASKAIGLTVSHPAVLSRFEVRRRGNALSVQIHPSLRRGKRLASRVKITPFSLYNAVGAMAFAYKSW